MTVQCPFLISGQWAGVMVQRAEAPAWHVQFWVRFSELYDPQTIPGSRRCPVFCKRNEKN